jgi:hypothetical protein
MNYRSIDRAKTMNSPMEQLAAYKGANASNGLSCAFFAPFFFLSSGARIQTQLNLASLPSSLHNLVSPSTIHSPFF